MFFSLVFTQSPTVTRQICYSSFTSLYSNGSRLSSRNCSLPRNSYQKPQNFLNYACERKLKRQLVSSYAILYPLINLIFTFQRIIRMPLHIFQVFNPLDTNLHRLFRANDGQVQSFSPSAFYITVFLRGFVFLMDLSTIFNFQSCTCI
jgi:hypothetical protein